MQWLRQRISKQIVRQRGRSSHQPAGHLWCGRHRMHKCATGNATGRTSANAINSRCVRRSKLCIATFAAARTQHGLRGGGHLSYTGLYRDTLRGLQTSHRGQRRTSSSQSGASSSTLLSARSGCGVSQSTCKRIARRHCCDAKRTTCASEVRN
jgi:hypothetical protein